MTSEAFDVLLHAIGWTDRRADLASPPTRNHLVTEADPGAAILELLAGELLEERRAPSFLEAGDRVFAATLEGRRVAAVEHRRRFPPLSRGKQRYLDWLRISDVCPDLTFGDYLRARSETAA